MRNIHNYSLMSVPANRFYYFVPYPELLDMDAGAARIKSIAYRRKKIKDAKKHNFNRRTYNESYITKSDNGRLLFVASVDQLTPSSVENVGSIGVGEFNTLCGRILFFDAHDTYTDALKNFYLAAYEWEDCCGVTLLNEVFYSKGDAERELSRMMDLAVYEEWEYQQSCETQSHEELSC